MTAPAGTDDSTASANGGRIDVHHHVVTPAARAWLVARGLMPPVGGPPWAQWSLQSTFDMMEQAGIAVGVLSAPTPTETIAALDAPAAAEFARITNESTAELVREYPTRFGFFAYLPLTHPDVAVAEISYALETLGADGVVLTNHAGADYLGDPVFEAVFAELDRHGAVALTHPFNLPDCRPSPVPTFLVDFLADTTRAAANLVLTGTLDRYPNVKIILPHGGGFFPYMAGRFQLGAYLGAGVDAGTAARSVRRFYYDTATAVSPYATPSLLAAAGIERLLFGSDWPAATAAGAIYNARALDEDPAFDDSGRQLVNRDNALTLLPNVARRLKA